MRIHQNSKKLSVIALLLALCGTGLYIPQEVAAQNSDLRCTPNRNTVSVGQTVTYEATGGDGTYEWTATDITDSDTGDTYTRTYTTPGEKRVLVQNDDDEIASCGVTVISAVTPGLPNTGVGGSLMMYIQLALITLGVTTLAVALVRNRFV